MKWEYLVLSVANLEHNQQDALDSWGADGWELIGATQHFLYLKKPKE